MAPLLLLTAAFHALFIARSSEVLAGRRYFILFDDAAISMRYAQNLADGHGLVWNPGEPAVEGITNPLWTLWMSVLHVVGLPRSMAGLGVMITSSLLLLACVVMAAGLARRVVPDLPVAPPVAAVLTASAYPLAEWSLRGMEVGALAAATLGAVLIALDWATGADDRPWALHALGALMLGMVAIRLDASVLAVLLLAWCIGHAGPTRRSRAVLVLGAWFGGGVAAMTAVRFAYYGELLPNTYYLKATGVSMGTRLGQGAQALGDVAVMSLAVLLVLAAGGVACGVARRRAGVVALPAVMVLAQLAYSVWTGGDAWEEIGYANRYIATVLPLLAVLAGIGVAALVDFGRPTFRPVARMTAGAGAVGCLVVAVWRPDPLTAAVVGGWEPWVVPLVAVGVGLLALALVPGAMLRFATSLPSSVAPAWQAAIAGVLVLVVVLAAHGNAGLRWHRVGPAYFGSDVRWAQEGLLLGACTTPGTTVGVFAAGQIIYYSDRPGVDLLGKSDREIARMEPISEDARPGHNKFSYEWSVDQLRPDVLTETGAGMPPDLWERAQQLGYQPVGRWLVHRDADGVDRDGLAPGLSGQPDHCRPET